MVLFLIGATCKGRRLLEGGAYFDKDNQSCGAYFETWRVLEEFRYSTVNLAKKLSMYRHLCSPSILFHKTNWLKFALLQLIIQKLPKLIPHTKFLMLRQQIFLSTQLQVASLVIKWC